MKQLDLGGLPGLHIDPRVLAAIGKTVAAWQAPFKGLPVHVRFRASGALRAWADVLDLPGLPIARQAFVDPVIPPVDAAQALMTGLSAYIRVSPAAEAMASTMIPGMVGISAEMLCFWLRDGVVYEPTVPLGGLLGGIDVAADLPLSFIAPPDRTLCILPPWQQRNACGGAQAITIHSHHATELQAPARRCLTIRASHVAVDEGVTIEELVLPVKDESRPLVQALSLAMEAAVMRQAEAGLEGEDLAAVEQKWRQTLDYTVKVLLYLQTPDAPVQARRPHSAAPRDFGGLGRKKREAKLADIDRLYDRFVVGPASSSDWAGEHAGQLGAGGQLSPHWRRGHFRQQAHGPAQSLRKLMFIKPTLVRVDRMAQPE